MEKDQIRQLLKNYKAGTCTPHERAIVESWYLNYRNGEGQPLAADELEEELDWIWGRVSDHVGHGETIANPGRGFRWIAAAAAVLLVGLVSVLYLYRSQQNRLPQLVIQADMAPGGNHATLTLADGSLVELSSEQSGLIMKSGIVTYTDGSTVPVDGAGETAATSYVISIPNGGQYQVVLTDGSTVWLNASSTLRYPSRFTGQNREVEIEGEAFFEVARDVDRPFVVRVKGHSVKVLGTAFNVSSYSDDPDTRVTLVHGSVEVADQEGHGMASAVGLKPGEQAVIDGKGIEVKAVNVAPYTAWRDGVFRFDETELRSVLRQLSRWYDMEVEYRGDIPDTYYYGQIGRNNNLSAVLRILKESGLSFTVENDGVIRKLVVHQ